MNEYQTNLGHRIRTLEHSIEMLKLYKRGTSPKDSDIQAEIQEEIEDSERYLAELRAKVTN